MSALLEANDPANDQASTDLLEALEDYRKARLARDAALERENMARLDVREAIDAVDEARERVQNALDDLGWEE